VTELLNASDINSTDLVLEIGAGKGIITEQLCQRAGQVIAIEKDEKLANEMMAKFKNVNNLKIHKRDFLEFGLPTTPYKVFANIPFSITAEIMNRILRAKNLPEEIYLILQKEVVEKFMGIPSETQSSVLAKPWYEVETLGEIDRTNFLFKPQVRIVFVRFKKRKTSFIKKEDKRDFWNFVTFGFGQWKPTVVEAYKKVFSFEQMDTLKKSLKLADKKPSELSFDTWLLFFKTYKRIASEKQKEVIRQ
jgi:23S rRNA (adenine-N6)-dimethyltransferase